MDPVRHRAGRVALVAMAAAALLALVVLVVLGVVPGSRPAEGPVADSRAAPPPAGERPAPSRFAPAAERSDLPHTKLPLRLVATVVRENRKLSLATVEDRERGGHEVMGEGQSFRNHVAARLVSIERGRVLIDNAGVHEQLVIDRSARLPDAAANAPSEHAVAYRRDLAQRLRELTDAGSDYRELRPTQGTGLFEEGDVRPVYEDGELIGVELDGLRAGGVYDQAGLRDGDLVTSVNGVSLGEPTAAAQVLAQLAVSDELSVAVERDDGSEELLSIPTSEFIDSLAGLEE